MHSLVDDHSRLAYCEILPDEKGPTCAAFLLRAAAYFAKHGITRIERVMTDNALSATDSRPTPPPRSTTLGATHKLIRPHCPWQNGKVERFNRTLQIEWAYRQVFTHQPRTGRRPCALARALQHSTPSHRTRRTTADQPSVTNLMG